MPSRVRCWLAPAVAVIGLAATAAQARPGPTLADVLRSAGDYLIQYSQLGAVDAEEEYTQYDTSSGQMRVPKRLNANVVLLGLGDGGFNGFRDVFGIDSAPVHPRDDRLLTIFKAPGASPLQDAARLSDESVRHYISRNLRALDQPAIALAFLRKDNQERSTFTLDSVKMMNGVEVAILKFTERRMPRVIPSASDAPAIGRFWIEVSTGAVRQTELGVIDPAANIRATVKYAADPALHLWLPVEMHQQIDISGAGTGAASSMGKGGGYAMRLSLEGRSTYAKFRQVPVDLSRIQ